MKPDVSERVVYMVCSQTMRTLMQKSEGFFMYTPLAVKISAVSAPWFLFNFLMWSSMKKILDTPALKHRMAGALTDQQLLRTESSLLKPLANFLDWTLSTHAAPQQEVSCINTHAQVCDCLWGHVDVTWALPLHPFIPSWFHSGSDLQWMLSSPCWLSRSCDRKLWGGSGASGESWAKETLGREERRV